jgi:hypothetical protein
MPNAIYPKWKEAVIQGGANSSLGGNVKAMLVDAADYVYSAAHEFLTSVPSIARVATSANLASKTYVNGAFDVADFSFATVSGDPSEAIVIFIDTGVEATSRLVAYLDTATGLPVTPNGTNINVTVNASGLFTL